MSSLMDGINHPAEFDFAKCGKRGDFIEAERFDSLWREVMAWYDCHVDQFVENIAAVYALTGNEHGYNALMQNWKSRRAWRGVGDTPYFSEDDIRRNIGDKLIAPFCWLYQKCHYGSVRHREFNEAMTGLMVTFRLRVTKEPSSEWNWYYGLSLDIGTSETGASDWR